MFQIFKKRKERLEREKREAKEEIEEVSIIFILFYLFFLYPIIIALNVIIAAGYTSRFLPGGVKGKNVINMFQRRKVDFSKLFNDKLRCCCLIGGDLTRSWRLAERSEQLVSSFTKERGPKFFEIFIIS